MMRAWWYVPLVILEEDMDTCMLVVGNLSDGFRFFGPFKDFEEACNYSERIDADNWVATLEPPDES